MSQHVANVSMVSGSAEDARSILALAEAHDGSSPVSDQAILAVTQGQRELFLFREAPGTTVAVGVIGKGELDLVVAPAHRGRGIGSAALKLLLEHNSESASGDLLAWAHGENPAANALLERANFTPVRSLYRMALDPELLPAPGSQVFAPEGFTLRNFDPAVPGDAAAWVRVNAAAFATHPEQGRITEKDFSLMREEPWYDDDDLFLLEEKSATDPRVVGFTWVKTVRDAAGAGVETELYSLGLDPKYAGKGLGQTLLSATLARMAEHRPDRVTLYVDGENERAVRMYEAAGFTIDSRSRQWRGGATG